jgi:hypothetical protein
MSFKIVLLQNIQGLNEVTVTTLNIQDGMLIKGNFRTPTSNIKYIEEV